MNSTTLGHQHDSPEAPINAIKEAILSLIAAVERQTEAIDRQTVLQKEMGTDISSSIAGVNITIQDLMCNLPGN